MIRIEDTRAVLHCDRCPVRIDLGPAIAHHAGRLRMPSNWLTVAQDRHVCPLHDVAFPISSLANQGGLR